MKSKKKKVAIIGCKYWGTNIIKTLLSFKNLHIICYDNNKTSLLKIKKRFNNINIAKNIKTILNDEDLKLTFICVTTSYFLNCERDVFYIKKTFF